MGVGTEGTIYNILQPDAENQFPEVRAVVGALKLAVRGLPHPPPNGSSWQRGMDVLDWLGFFFGFQADNVRNQREHVVLLLANYQMSMQPIPEARDRLERGAVRHLRKKVLKNYKKWCSFLSKKPNLWLPKNFRMWLPRNTKLVDHHRELTYSCLYLLIWGESANLRFMPECLCFMFHHMAMELNNIVEGHRHVEGYVPSSYGWNGFLTQVVEPIYKAVKGEADSAKGGKAPHSTWRNYDDMNEYFWSKRCFRELSWPLNLSSGYLLTSKGGNRGSGLYSDQHRVGKTGFVEQRSFWNIFRSFDHLWVGLFLMLQAMIILSFNGDGVPWHVLYNRDVQGALLSIFISWSSMRFVQAVLELGLQYSLISRETKLVGVRMLLKLLVSIGWVIIFFVLLMRISQQRAADGQWSAETNRRLFQFLEAVAVFLLPELLAIILFLLPWIRNAIERTEWSVLHALTWWFETGLFVGRGLREGIIDNLRYTTFWLVVLFFKFSFSYFMQIRPLVDPTRELLALNAVSYKWHEFFSNQNRFVVVVIWAPVVLVYLMDLQIWYSIFSSLVGALVGLSSHIGEIRNMEQFKLRFPFFASAMTFNLMAAEGLRGGVASTQSYIVALFRDMLRRVMLRYGLVKAYKTYEKSSLESRKFAYLWNQIIFSLRQEHLLNDHEVELLQVPDVALNVKVMQWPSLLLSNELRIALGVAQSWQGKEDKELWQKISKQEYRRCAVLECYDSVKLLLLTILKDGSKEHSIVAHVFKKIEMDIELGAFAQNHKLNGLTEVHSRVLALVEVLLSKPALSNVHTVVNSMQNLYDVVIRDFCTQNQQQYPVANGTASNVVYDELLFCDAMELPNADDDVFFLRLRRLHTILNTRDAMNDVPRNFDARRRIAFFGNSLFMSMPHAPIVEKMLSFSVLTPYNSEDVLYTKEQLRIPNEDGVTLLFYLQSIYPDEWKNFCHQVGNHNPETECWNDREKARMLRLWASHRGQTLARTVRGMMYYEKALETLAYLDAASEAKLSDCTSTAKSKSSRGIGNQQGSVRGQQNSSIRSDLTSRHRMKSKETSVASMKFTYVIACQNYGIQKAKKDSKADDILYLMKCYPAMRVAYVDEVGMGVGKKYYSVLVKYDPLLGIEVEIYRVQLPGPTRLGEGKPENQNHALIFTRGDAIQTVDMNQDNCFEEALKIRNLLQEFTKQYGLRRPQILGVREHVLTGSVSSLAWFMSAQETSFGTVGQRVLANPLKARMHYGHADVFDRLWFITRGGISKASRVINTSEDIFAGFNCTLRGGNVTHHEYIQVGKGRDVGLNQIALFEAKVSSGNGEQISSRDVYRLAHRLDFFRMLSFYHTTVGFYVGNMIMVWAVYAFLWARVYLALSGLEDLIADSINNIALTASLNQQFVVQLGLFTALPMVVESTLEHGFGRAMWDLLIMQLELCSVFFTFSLGTKCHYFGRTLLHGGAKYRSKGHGFVVRRVTFVENFRLFSRSHFVKGIELIILLVIYEAYGGAASNTTVYIFLTISSWFLALSWIVAPYLFNPTGFDWLQTVYDFEGFCSWLWYGGGVLARSDLSWETWWNEEQDHLRTTNFWGKLLEVALSLRFFVIQYGLVYRLHIAANSRSIVVYFVSWLYVISAMALHLLVAFTEERYSARHHLYYRAIQAVVAFLLAIIVILLVKLTSFHVSDLFLSLLAFIPTGWGLLNICLVLKPFLVIANAWPLIVSVARLYDLGIGLFVMIPVAVLSWLPGFQAMQTRLLFNQAFSRGLQISQILSANKPNKNGKS
ncbi:hypothetical protein GOP47_0024305 [Adiantum capillus-veneris]|uniref:1,3-beta-glucan synthase n=1 Tax=Adiantum capillus-veneris TaxID=13818 RepID=A0A9D4U1W4_ADICA|nr:hypothetical protein GOP47_0024305 [Adiantum capillus-veneris]